MSENKLKMKSIEYPLSTSMSIMVPIPNLKHFRYQTSPSGLWLDGKGVRRSLKRKKRLVTKRFLLCLVTRIGFEPMTLSLEG